MPKLPRLYFRMQWPAKLSRLRFKPVRFSKSSVKMHLPVKFLGFNLGDTRFHRTRIVTKLLISFLVISSILAVVGFLGMIGIQQMNARTSHIIDQTLPKVAALDKTRALFFRLSSDFQQAVMDTYMANSSLNLQQDVAQTQIEEKQLSDAFATYLKYPHTAEEQSDIRNFQQAHQEWLDVFHQMTPLLQNPTPQEQTHILALIRSQWLPQANDATFYLSNLETDNLRQSLSIRDEASNAFTQFVWLLLSAIVIAFALAFGFGFLMSRAIAAPIVKMVRVAQEGAKGNLAHIDHSTSQRRSKNEVDHLVLALDDMISNLRKLVTGIKQSSANLSVSSESITIATNQAGEATAHVVQLMQQVTDGAQDQCVHLNRAAQDTEQLAQQSMSVQREASHTLERMRVLKGQVSAIVTHIQRLNERSHETKRIIQMIKDIAELTDLLAINASIEAAHAGSYGNGFAVVAREIRKLAERTTEATKEISEILLETQKESNNAVTAVNNGIVEVDATVAQAIQSQDKAQEMLQSAESLRQTIVNVASVSEENSAIAEGVSSSAEEIASQIEETIASASILLEMARELENMVAIFRLENASPDEDGTSSPATDRGERPLANVA